MRFVRRHWPWLAIALFLFIVHLSSVSSELGGHMGGDNIIYFLLGKAIANGDGYVDLYLPGNPVHRKYPFVFPLLLAPFHLLFDHPLAAMHTMIVAFWVASFIIFGLFLQRRLGDRPKALALTLIVGLSPRLYMQGAHLLSEAPFIAFTYAALWLAAGPRRPAPVAGDDPGKGRPGSAGGPSGTEWPRLAGLIALSLCAYYTRTAAVALGAAVTVSLLRSGARVRIVRPIPAGLIFAATFAAGVLAWWAFANGERGFAYFGEFMRSDPYDEAAGRLSVATLAARLKDNLVYYLPPVGIFSAPPLAWLIVYPLLFQIAGGLGCLAVFFGWGRELRRRGGAVEWFFIFSLAIILLWPFHEDRFLMPIIPLGMFYFFSAAEWAADRLASGRRRLALAAVFLCLLVSELFLTGKDVSLRLHPDLHPRQPVPVRGFGVWNTPVVNWSKYDGNYVTGGEEERDTLDALTRYLIISYALVTLTPADAVIISRKPMLTYYCSGRKSVPIIPNDDPDFQWDYIQRQRVDYVVIGLSENALAPLFSMAPDRFKRVAEINDRTNVFKVVNRNLPPPE